MTIRLSQTVFTQQSQQYFEWLLAHEHLAPPHTYVELHPIFHSRAKVSLSSPYIHKTNPQNNI